MMDNEPKIKKIVEIYPMYCGTRYNFYADDHGSEEGTYQACASRASAKQVFWDPKFCSWYYYL